MVKIFAIRLVEEEKFNEVKPLLLEQLPAPVKENLKRFRNPAAMQRNILGEVLCRIILSQRLNIPPYSVETYRSEKGKPYYTDYPEWHFNISHSAEWVVMAFSDKEIGIDIEEIRKINYHLAKRFFSPEENENLNKRDEPEKLNYFFDLWTLKESYLKYLGRGLTKALKSFTIHDIDGRFHLMHDLEQNSKVHFRQYDVGECCKCSVCASSETFNDEIEFISHDKLQEMIV